MAPQSPYTHHVLAGALAVPLELALALLLAAGPLLVGNGKLAETLVVEPRPVGYIALALALVLPFAFMPLLIGNGTLAEALAVGLHLVGRVAAADGVHDASAPATRAPRSTKGPRSADADVLATRAASSQVDAPADAVLNLHANVAPPN